MIDDGKILGSNITSFRKRFMQPHPYIRSKWELREGAKDEIHKLVAPIVYQVDPATLKDEPPQINDIWVNLPERTLKQYKQMEKDFILDIEEKGLTIEAFSESGKITKLLQIANGIIWHEYDDGTKAWEELHNAKLEALDDIIAEAAGAPVLVVYQWVPDLKRLQTRYGKRLQTLNDGKHVVTDWNNGRVEILALHPASGGHGLNLQFGGHIQAWLGLTYNLEYYQQTIARMHGRHGQTCQVEINRIMANDTMDIVPKEVLASKDNTQQTLFECVQKYIGKMQ